MTRLFIDSNAGLCPGVKRALSGAFDYAQKRKKVVSYGDIIHNPAIIAKIETAGISTIHHLKDVPAGASVLIRAHGILPEEEDYLKKAGIEYLDLTCAIVKKVHNIITQYKNNSYQIIIVGKKEHPETVAHLGYAGAGAVVINSVNEVAGVDIHAPCLAVAQTTTSYALFLNVLTELKARIPELKGINTICSFVRDRQEWIRQYAEKCDCSLIIGGRQSSNTARLYEIASRFSRAFWIENENEFTSDMIPDNNSIALTAGTSTMEETISKVIEKLYSKEIFPVFLG